MSQVRYKFGVHVPRTYKEAIMMDKKIATHFGKMQSERNWITSFLTSPSKICV